MSNSTSLASTCSVYNHSATRYVEQVGTTITSRFETLIDRTTLDTFADRIVARGNGPVLDVGCGTGRATAYLSERELNIRGTDLAPKMIDAARLAHPHLQFDVGSLTAIPAPNSSLAGIVLWYSIIHTPLSGLTDVWVELLRVLAVPGLVLLGFQAGENNLVQYQDAYGSSATLSLYRHAPDDVVQSLLEVGFNLEAKVWRAAELEHETTPQAFLIVTK